MYNATAVLVEERMREWFNSTNAKAMQYKINVQWNIETVEWFETLLNNRLLLKGITFAKMYDTFWQKSFFI